MTAIAEVDRRLARYPEARYSIEVGRISVHPADEDGFTVGLEEGDGKFTVFFDGWHEHFTERAEALDCVAFGLSASCRLAVVYRGSTPVRWTVEALGTGGWEPESTTGLIFYPYWRRRRLVHLQNHLLPVGRPPEP
jgi:hypothetical protein